MNPLNRLVYERAGTSPAMMRRLAAQLDREMSPYEVFPAATVMRWVAGAVLRGNFSIVPAFFAVGKRTARVVQVRKERLALLQ